MKTKCINKTFQSLEAFTLSEILIVIVIAGTLAGLALPRFRIGVEKAKAAEAVQILNTLLKAQKVYKLEQGSYTNSTADLDIEFANGTITQFQNPVAFAAVAENENVVKIKRNSIEYTLAMTGEGVIFCDDTAATWANICTLMGY